MAVNKVVYNTENGAETLIDLTEDTVTPETLAEGATAHDASGEEITGIMPITTVLYTEQNLTEEQKTQARENLGIDGVCVAKNQGAVNAGKILVVGTDGNFTLTDMPEGGASGDVNGVLDESKNILLSGDLADGTYSLKWLLENGSYADAGTLTVKSLVTYNITKNLTNCTINNNVTQVNEGSSYSATITANSGYELSSITVTMGGANVSVSNGVINIQSVSGDIVITATAVEEVVEPAYTNLANPNDANWKNNTRINSSYGEVTYEGITTTNYIEVKSGDIIRVKNIDFKAATYISYSKIIQYNNGTPVNALTPTGNASEFVVDGNGVTTITVKGTNPWTVGTHIRLSGKLTGTSVDVIITKNEAIV